MICRKIPLHKVQILLGARAAVLGARTHDYVSLECCGFSSSCSCRRSSSPRYGIHGTTQGAITGARERSMADEWISAPDVDAGAGVFPERVRAGAHGGCRSRGRRGRAFCTIGFHTRNAVRKTGRDPRMSTVVVQYGNCTIIDASGHLYNVPQTAYNLLQLRLDISLLPKHDLPYTNAIQVVAVDRVFGWE